MRGRGKTREGDTEGQKIKERKQEGGDTLQKRERAGGNRGKEGPRE